MPNTSNNVPEQGSNVDPVTNTPPNVGNSGLNVSQTPTLEELQQQLVDAKKQLEKFDKEAFQAREKERQRKEREAADKAALEQQLREQGQFKTLAEQLQTTVSDLQSQITQRDTEIAKRDYEALRSQVATKHGLAPEFAARLSGSTEEELNADATKLKQLIGETTPARPGNGKNPPPGQQGPSRDEQKASFKQERMRRGMYGL